MEGICDIGGCGLTVYGHGLCNMHYQRMRRNGHVDLTTKIICEVTGCTSKHVANGLCQAHYLRMRKHGTLEKLTMHGASITDRIMAKVEIQSNGCWIFTGVLTEKGYGHIRLGHKMRVAHEIMYEAKHGPVPGGLELDHFHCDRKACCNPDHVKPVTHQENIARAVALSLAWGVAALLPEERIARAKKAAAIRWGHQAADKELI